MEESKTVTIPRNEYNVLIKKAIMLDMALVAAPAKYGYEKEQVLNLMQDMIAGGWLEC